jgi:hypothetical protein
MPDYPWFRVYNEVLTDRKLERIRQTTHLPRVVIRGAWLTIMAMANDSPERGYLLYAPDIPVSDDDLCDDLEMDRSDFNELMAAFARMRMVHRDTCTVCTNFSKRQFKSDNSTPRVQAHRARKRAEASVETVGCNVSETLLCNAPETDTDTETDTETERESTPTSPNSRAHINRELHPALAIYCEQTGLSPPKSDQWKMQIVETVGALTPRLDLWSQVIHGWVGMGWKATNIAGMLDRFRAGDIPKSGERNDGRTGSTRKRKTSDAPVITGLGKKPDI